MSFQQLLLLAADQAGHLILADRSTDRDRRFRRWRHGIGLFDRQAGQAAPHQPDQMAEIDRPDLIVGYEGRHDLGGHLRQSGLVGTFGHFDTS
jgi:hypothetical protein